MGRTTKLLADLLRLSLAISLGSTPTAMAKHAAVAQDYGPGPIAPSFIVPLVLDSSWISANALVISALPQLAGLEFRQLLRFVLGLIASWQKKTTMTIQDRHPIGLRPYGRLVFPPVAFEIEGIEVVRHSMI